METALEINQNGIRKAPSIEQLEQFAERLNKAPEKEWLQKTPDGNAEYIPVGIIENQLRQDFMNLVSFEVISERRELNEYIVVARISVYHPLLGQWMHYDGIGAKVITQNRVPELDQDRNPIMQNGRQKTRSADLSEFNDTKQKNALEMNAPNAYAEAIKNAAKKIGKKYGADINRKHEDSYSPIYTQEAEFNGVQEEVERILKGCETLDELQVAWANYPDLHKNPHLLRVFGKKKQEINLKNFKNK